MVIPAGVVMTIHDITNDCNDDIAAIAQLGERQTEDLKVPGSIPGHGILFVLRATKLKM